MEIRGRAQMEFVGRAFTCANFIAPTAFGFVVMLLFLRRSFFLFFLFFSLRHRDFIAKERGEEIVIRRDVMTRRYPRIISENISARMAADF